MCVRVCVRVRFSHVSDGSDFVYVMVRHRRDTVRSRENDERANAVRRENADADASSRIRRSARSRAQKRRQHDHSRAHREDLSIYIHRPCDVEAHEYKAPDAYLKAARDESSPLANANNLASSLSRTLHRSPVPQPCHRRASSPRARKRDMFTHHQRLTRAQPRTKTPHTTHARQRPTTANRIVIIRRKTTTTEPCIHAHRTFYHEAIVITSISHAHRTTRARDDDIRTETRARRAIATRNHDATMATTKK